MDAYAVTYYDDLNKRRTIMAVFSDNTGLEEFVDRVNNDPDYKYLGELQFRIEHTKSFTNLDEFLKTRKIRIY